MKMNISGCFTIIAAMMIGYGCTTHDAATCNAQIAAKDPCARMLTGTHLFTIYGGLPVKESGASFYYRGKCVVCGAVADEQIGTTIPKGTSTIVSDYTCPKCGNKQTVRIVIKERTSNQAAQATAPKVAEPGR